MTKNNIILNTYNEINDAFDFELSINYEDSWKPNNRKSVDRLHSISYYVAMFPPQLSNYFIQNFSEKGDMVVDTFSGRGTTILECRQLERKSIGIDLNPLAYVLTRAKVRDLSIEKIINRITDLENSYNLTKKDIRIPRTKDILKIKAYYSNETIRQLLFIKNKIGINFNVVDDIDNFILSILLGIMHGPARKDNTSQYISISTSNTLCFSPNYVNGYAIKHGLKINNKINVFQKIEDRVKFTFAKTRKYNIKAKNYFGDSLLLDKFIKKNSVDLIFTSPPYLNIIKYAAQNWLKIWLLGYDNNNLIKNIKLDDSHKLEEYKSFIIKYFNSVEKVLKINKILALVIGDVRNIGFQDIWIDIRDKIPNFKLKKIYIDEIDQNMKATNHLGSKRGLATRVDKIYIFERIK